MNQRLKRLKGFTLIEVLVVIIIIGILTTVSIVALNSSRVKARDSRRLSDIKQLQTALELYNADEFNYPQAITPGQPLIGLSSKKTYMSKVPNNPSPMNDGLCSKVNQDYGYIKTGEKNYELHYCLSEVGPTMATAAGGLSYKTGLSATVPFSLKLEDFSEKLGSPTASSGWDLVSSSGDGSVVIVNEAVSGGLRKSTNNGETWSSIADSLYSGTDIRYIGVADDGQRMINQRGSYYVDTSIDGGITWKDQGSILCGGYCPISIGVKISSNGQKVYAASYSGSLIIADLQANNTLTNVVSSTVTSTPYLWKTVSVSENGKIALSGTTDNSYYYDFVSVDNGLTWKQISNPRPGIGSHSLSYSKDGSKLVLSVYQNANPASPLYYSTDDGMTWIDNSVAIRAKDSSFYHRYNGVVISSDGSRIAGVNDYGKQVNYSLDGGETWNSYSLPANYGGIAFSSDLTQMIVSDKGTPAKLFITNFK